MITNEPFQEASIKTANNLRTVAHSAMIRDVSRLSLPEIDGTVDLISRVVPAGNVPGLILNGLARLPGRRPPAEIVKRDIHLLFKGVESALDKAVYGAFFAGPAAVIWGYQNLLKLAGKQLEDAFPDGVWQFYVEYALREDTARHANETHGFDTLLDQHQTQLNQRDRICAWTMAAIQCLHQYNDWLANEWRERIYTDLLGQATAHLPAAEQYANLYPLWQKEKPYGRGSDVDPQHNYAAYRRQKFDAFLAAKMQGLEDAVRREWRARIQSAGHDLEAYQRQMTILAHLEPGPYGESRVLHSLADAQVGLIFRGRYYLIPACRPDTLKPAQVQTVRAQIAFILSQPTARSTFPLSALARTRRAGLFALQSSWNSDLRQGIAQLRQAPILLNVEQRSAHQPLSEIRLAERGIGDHALTIFDTGETFVFDQSHIFFDGAWGAGLAEILTREALSWAVYLNRLPEAEPAGTVMKPLRLPIEPTEMQLIEQAPKASQEVSAETEAVQLKRILSLRRLFKQRSDLLNLTVNDLLVLYRAIHTLSYRLAPSLQAELTKLAQDRRSGAAAQAALEAFEKNREIAPAILIPIDATQQTPRERVYPLVFEVPLQELDLLRLHQETLAALDEYEQGTGDRSAAYAQFDRLQREYLATLAGLSEVLNKAKEIGVHGSSASVETIKLLAYMPAPVQRLLDKIPNRFDILNDLIKGREVFSNVGAVVPGSTLRRFVTAKDDNEKKSLAWGVLTDAGGVMRITLRDFRPHVGLLEAAGHRALAARIAQHYLDTYVQGLNEYVSQVRRITHTSRETYLLR